MKITLLCTGKTSEGHIADGLKIYLKRLKHYIPFEIICTQDIKIPASASPLFVQKAESEQQLKQISTADKVILLDENGKGYSSEAYAKMIEQFANASCRHLMFVIGGPYGFAEEVRKKAHTTISLSPMTFSHQLVRLVFAEQLYRAFTIIRNEKYHH